MSVLENLLTRILNKAEITYKMKLSPSVWHIRIKSEAIAKANYLPGHFIRLLAGKGNDTSFKEKVRSYSVWNIDQDKGSIDLAVCIHSQGPGASWAQGCAVGDLVYFAWKKSNFMVDQSADTSIFIGDLSTLGHLYEIQRNLPMGKQVLSLIYNSDKGDFFKDIDGSQRFDFYELPENPGAELIKLLPGLLGKASGKVMAYIGGDSRVCVELDRYLRLEHHWQRSQLKVKPFWNPEKRGLE